MTQLNIGFVGAGRAGTNLAKYFAESGLNISGFFIRKNASLQEFPFKLFTNLTLFIKECDVIFLTVQDDKIVSVVNQLSNLNEDFTGKAFAHTSGSNSVSQLNPLLEKGASIFTFHPLQSFSSMKSDTSMLKNMHIFVENGENPSVEEILKTIGNPFHNISTEDKSKYHCAASIISNLSTGLIDFGFELMEDLGVSREESREAFRALIEGTNNNILRHGTKEALTGPISRGDFTTVQKHLDILDEEQSALYRLLAMRTLRLAEGKITPEQYKKIEEQLRKDDINDEI